MPELRRDELPEELLPLFDALTLELHRVHDQWQVVHRLRRVTWFSTGALVAAVVINVAVAIGRALA